MEVYVITKLDMNIEPPVDVAIVPCSELSEKETKLLETPIESMDSYDMIRFKALVLELIGRYEFREGEEYHLSKFKYKKQIYCRFDDDD